jgi:hypothetical protein
MREDMGRMGFDDYGPRDIPMRGMPEPPPRPMREDMGRMRFDDFGPGEYPMPRAPEPPPSPRYDPRW